MPRRAVSASKGNYERLRGSKLSLRSERPPRIVHQNLKAMIWRHINE
jgi:hypothetical protein